MIKRNAPFLATIAAAIALAGFNPDAVEAQGPDIRAIPPVVVMMVDTSGSMEKLGNCACVTPACTECLPDCSVANPERNRWNSIVEALNGTYNDYTCLSRDRNSASFSGEPDYRYFLPHIQAQFTSQNTDGILDVYRDRVRFGLMTFDTTSTFLGQGELVTQVDFLSQIGINPLVQGGYSYGNPAPFSFPGCGQPYMIDNGSRNESAPNAEGRLVSVGTEGTMPDMPTINGYVQAALRDIRPYGPTPIAGMLTDLDYYFGNHPDVRPNLGGNGDPFFECRTRFGILITDGRPNQDMRGAPYFCEALGQPVGASGCPYDTPENLAAQMLADEDIQGLYVIGFDVDGSNCGGDAGCISRANDARDSLNDIAMMGGTGTALFASNRAQLVSTLASILDLTAPGTTTRTVPAFTNVPSVGVGSGSQMQFNTGFNVSVQQDDPWSGKLERRRIECDGLVPVTRDIEDRDRFHLTLDNQTSIANGYGESRRLLTVLPPAPGLFASHISNDAIRDEVDDRVSTIPSGSRGSLISSWNPASPSTHFARSNASLNDTMLNVPDMARRNEIIDWTHGVAGTVRENKRLGAIVHSSPAVIGPPQLDIADESFNAFRTRPDVVNRPTVMYVGTNDGILHAFAVQDYCPADGTPACVGAEARVYNEGEEIWGFIPPMLFHKYDSVLNSHQWMADGSPIVKNMFDARLLGAGVDQNQYRTMLFMGMRQGANGFIAMDVTDPINPKFVWQYTDPDFGETYADPAPAQVRMRLGTVSHERGIAILPGGNGSQLPGTAVGPIPANGVTGVLSPRTTRRNWDTTGRALVILDVATGAVLRKWDSTTFPAPLNGGVTAYPSATGTLASRAYFTDADGILWRLNLEDEDPANWSVAPLHDIFHGLASDAGQPALQKPVVSINNNSEVVILQATGNLDRLEDVTAVNRVFSFTEELTFNTGTGAIIGVGGRLNWQITLEPGEQVTGPLELFNQRVYFGSFVASSNVIDACQVGFSRLWGVEFLANQNGSTPGPFLPNPGLETAPGTFVMNQDSTSLPDLDNRLIMGVAVARRPTCVDASEPSETDPYLGARQSYQLNNASAPVYQLTALLGGRDAAGVGGSSIQEFTQTIQPPVTYTDSRAYLPVVD